MKRFFAQFCRKQTPIEAAIGELVEAEHALLKAQTGGEWAGAHIEYNQLRVARLRQYVIDVSKGNEARAKQSINGS